MQQYLQVHVRTRHGLYQQKDNYAQGVRYNTPADSAIIKSQSKANRAAEKYHTPRDVMLRTCW